MKNLISNRVSDISPSMTLAVTEKANQLKSKGANIISFGAGEPDFETPKHIQKAGINAIKSGKSRYTAVSGILPLREAVAKKFLVDNQLEYTTDEIIINSGAKHSISTALQAICNPKDEVIIPVPYWVSYPEMVKLAGAIPVLVKTKAENSFKLTASELQSAVTPNTKAILINSPSNPVGAVYSEEELQAIAKIAVESQIYIISDEIYEKLVYDGKKHISIASLNKSIKELSIVINGMSKTYAMTGWRLGYTAANRSVIQAMTKIQGHAISHASSITQYAGLAALEGDEDLISNMLLEYDKRKSYMVDYLEHINKLDIIYPDGAFYVLVDISKIFGSKINNIEINSSLDFANALLEYAEVAIIPGIAFGLDNYIRLSYATSLEQIKEGLNRIEDFINKLQF